MTKIRKDICDCLDAHILDLLKKKTEETLESQNRPVQEPDVPARPRVPPRVASAVLASFTQAKVFEKCSGGALQLDNADDIGFPSVRGSVHLGRLANTGEVYAPFSAFGLLRDDNHRPSAATLVVNEHAGALNRLLQWGECPRATKSSGSYGGGLTPPTSSAWLGNMHPEIAVPMDLGALGSHTGATKERILFYTGRPVPPHSAIPSTYVLPESHDPWAWARQSSWATPKQQVAVATSKKTRARPLLCPSSISPTWGWVTVEDDEKEKEVPKVNSKPETEHVINLAMLARLHGLEEGNLMFWVFEYGEEEGLMCAIDELHDRLNFETKSVASEVPWKGEVLQVHLQVSPQPTKKEEVRFLFRGSGGGLGMQRVHGGSSLTEWYLGLQGQGLGRDVDGYFTTLGGRILDPKMESSGLGLVGLQEVVFNGSPRSGTVRGSG